MDYHGIDEIVDIGLLVNVVKIVNEVKAIYVENNPIK